MRKPYLWGVVLAVAGLGAIVLARQQEPGPAPAIDDSGLAHARTTLDLAGSPRVVVATKPR